MMVVILYARKLNSLESVNRIVNENAVLLFSIMCL